MGLLNISSWVAKEQPFTSLLKGKVINVHANTVI